jgi:hypothetical protein
MSSFVRLFNGLVVEDIYDLVMLPLVLVFIVLALALGEGTWTLESPVGPFVLYTCTSFAVFVLFCLVTPEINASRKFRLCLEGGVGPFLLALVFNEFSLGLAKAADRRLLGDAAMTCPEEAGATCMGNLWMEMFLLFVCAVGEETWKLRMLKNAEISDSPGTLGACAGFGFMLMENVSYFRFALSGKEAWKIGVSRSMSPLHPLTTALSAAVALPGKREISRVFLGVAVAATFHTTHNVASAVIEERLGATTVGRIVGAGNLAAIAACLYIVVSR